MIRSRRGPDPESAPDGSPFLPVVGESRYARPRAGIDPDPSKTWLRRALPVLGAHRGIFITSLVLSFVGLILQVQVPNLLNRAIDNSVQHHTVPLHHYVWWIVVLGVAGGLTGYVSRLFLFKTAYAIEFDFRNILYEHLTNMSFPFYDRVQSGQLISRANSDIRSVQMYMTFAPSIMVQCGVAVVAFGFMLSINVVLAIIAMATMPLVVVVGVKMRQSMFPVSWLIQARLADVATIVDENINGVRVVKSFAAEEQQLRSLAKAADKVEWGYVKDADLRARWTPTLQNLPQLGLVLVVAFGGYMVIHGQLQLGAILAFNGYLLMMQAPFTLLGMILMMGQRAAASAERIYEVLDEQPSIVDRPGAVDLIDCEGDIRFEAVDFAYASAAPGPAATAPSGPSGTMPPGPSGTMPPGPSGTVPPPAIAPAAPTTGPLVLDGFDLHLRPGETVALVGRTGSGKSTVARLLTRFYDVTGGTVRVEGHDVRDLTLASLRAQVGIVLDEPFLFSVSIRDNIAYGRPDADLAEIKAAAVAAGADEFVVKLPDGYDSVVGERGYTLSGGQRQRIAIARTLLLNPPILVLDDATSAIDVELEKQIHASLKILMRDRTTLIIAHRLSTISLAERVVLLDHGRIVADGTHAELLETVPLYAEVLAQAAIEAAESADDDTPELPRPAVGRRRQAGAQRPGIL